jgi:hypothetical protein
MDTVLFTFQNTLKKMKERYSRSRGRKYIVRNMQAIDWISDSLISAGANIIKSDTSTNSFNHEKNSI